MPDPIRAEDYLDDDLDQESRFPFVFRVVDDDGRQELPEKPQTNRELITNLLYWTKGSPSDELLHAHGLTRAHADLVMVDLGERLNQLRARWEHAHALGLADEGPPPEPFLTSRTNR
jgi:hypothetical protein